jgi:ABC-type Na+ efflux pump permease subunit
MYATVLTLHSACRWLVLLSLPYALFRAYSGLAAGRPFTKTDNAVRHWAATIAHVQLLLGMALYVSSPAVKAGFASLRATGFALDAAFFSILHPLLMLVSVVLITIGSALAKRRAPARTQFQTLLRWYGVALLSILLFIPWPFSPLASRALFRI